MKPSNYIEIKAANKSYLIVRFKKINELVYYQDLAVNIIASGPSISNINYRKGFIDSPTIFVNGSITLLEKFDFTNVIGYVISDDRFIKHNAKIIKKMYTGQPFFITKPVADALANDLPEIIEKYHGAINIIYPVNRPLPINNESTLLKSLPLLSRLTNKNILLHNFIKHDEFVIDILNYPKPIGVSLNIEKGFVEAGTVAFVATQLAYTLEFKQINLYGLDLINSSQPRFYESIEDTVPCKLDKAITDRIVPSFNLLGLAYKKQGVTVINHSPVSKELFTTI